MRALLYADEGRVITTAQRDITQHYPSPGWVEHDPDEIWERTLACAREVAASVDDPTRIAGIGITNQRETVVVLGQATGKPLARAIVWQDRRTADACAARCAKQATSRRSAAATGLVLDPYFSAIQDRAGRWTKWPQLAAAGDRLALGTVESWLVWKLTGRLRTSPTPATPAAPRLMAIDRRGVGRRPIDLFGVPRASLPEIVDMRRRTRRCATRNGSGAAIPICGLAGDQQAATIGQGCLPAGRRPRRRSAPAPSS